MPPKGSKKKMVPTGRQIELERLPLLKKPQQELPGKFVNVPGKYWEGL